MTAGEAENTLHRVQTVVAVELLCTETHRKHVTKTRVAHVHPRAIDNT